VSALKTHANSKKNTLGTLVHGFAAIHVGFTRVRSMLLLFAWVLRDV